MGSITAAQRTRLFGPSCRVRTTRVRTPWQGDIAVVHELIAPVFIEACMAAFNDPHAGFSPRRVDSYACRNIRGRDEPSLHSWALAIDPFVTDEGVPPPGGVWKPAVTVTPEFARHFTQRGFAWGRWFTRQDWPHLEWPGRPPGPRPSSPITPQEARVALNKPACSIVASPSGFGYWLVAEDGGIFAFGDATPFGDNSLPSRVLAAPVVAAARTSTGRGLWLAAEDGGVFTFGDARFFGSKGGERLNAPIIAIAANTLTDSGYWLAAADGGVFAFGDAGFHGSAA